MILDKTFKVIGIISTTILLSNFISWLIWGLDEIPVIAANCLTECVYETPDSVFIYIVNNSDLNIIEGSIESFSIDDKKKFENMLSIFFHNKPQIYLRNEEIHNNVYGIVKPVFYIKFIRIIPFYLSIDSGVFWGEGSLGREWKGFWFFGWLVKSNYVTCSA